MDPSSCSNQLGRELAKPDFKPMRKTFQVSFGSLSKKNVLFGYFGSDVIFGVDHGSFSLPTRDGIKTQAWW